MHENFQRTFYKKEGKDGCLYWNHIITGNWFYCCRHDPEQKDRSEEMAHFDSCWNNPDPDQRIFICMYHFASVWDPVSGTGCRSNRKGKDHCKEYRCRVRSGTRTRPQFRFQRSRQRLAKLQRLFRRSAFGRYRCAHFLPFSLG